jgi:hypothetical protein
MATTLGGSGAMPCGRAVLRRHADVKSKMQDLLTRAERSERSSQGVPMPHLLRRMDHYRELRGRCEARPGDHQALLAWLDSILLALGEFGAPMLLDHIVTAMLSFRHSCSAVHGKRK